MNLLENQIFLTQKRLVHRAGVLAPILIAAVIGLSLADLFAIVWAAAGILPVPVQSECSGGYCFWAVCAMGIAVCSGVHLSRVGFGRAFVYFAGHRGFEGTLHSSSAVRTGTGALCSNRYSGATVLCLAVRLEKDNRRASRRTQVMTPASGSEITTVSFFYPNR